MPGSSTLLTPPRLLSEDRNHQSKMAAIIGQSAFVRVAPKAVAKVRRPSERTHPKRRTQQNVLLDRSNTFPETDPTPRTPTLTPSRPKHQGAARRHQARRGVLRRQRRARCLEGCRGRGGRGCRAVHGLPALAISARLEGTETAGSSRRRRSPRRSRYSAAAAEVRPFGTAAPGPVLAGNAKAENADLRLPEVVGGAPAHEPPSPRP